MKSSKLITCPDCNRTMPARGLHAHRRQKHSHNSTPTLVIPSQESKVINTEPSPKLPVCVGGSYAPEEVINLISQVAEMLSNAKGNINAWMFAQQHCDELILAFEKKHHCKFDKDIIQYAQTVDPRNEKFYALAFNLFKANTMRVYFDVAV